MINDIFIKSIEEETFDTEVLSDMIYQNDLSESGDHSQQTLTLNFEK